MCPSMSKAMGELRAAKASYSFSCIVGEGLSGSLNPEPCDHTVRPLIETNIRLLKKGKNNMRETFYR